MSRYEIYKPSGIDWIGDVPLGWEVKKLKHILLGVNSGEGISNNELEENGEFEIYGGNGVMGYTNKYNSDGKVIVIGRVGAKCGVTYLLDKKVWISDNALQTRTYQNYKYLYYLLDAIDFNQYANQNAQPLITGTIVKNFPIPFIRTKEEQIVIANYLDDQTQKIDRLIANKKAQAEKLKELRQIEINNVVTKGLNPNAEMKDSGIEWLGQIPKHWTTKRMKDIASVRGRIGFRGYTVDDIVEEGALVIGAKHINASNQLTFDDPEFISWEKYYESPEIMVEVGDILIVQRGSVGKFALVNKEIGAATINPSMILLRLNSIIHPQFLFWYLLGEHIFNVIKTIVSSTAVPMISQMQAGVFRIILPPKEEQTAIASYLQKRTTAIDLLIKNIEAQIEKLQELRKIKIYEAVTGKIKVNGHE